eukprot:gene11398-biopygen7219
MNAGNCLGVTLLAMPPNNRCPPPQYSCGTISGTFDSESSSRVISTIDVFPIVRIPHAEAGYRPDADSAVDGAQLVAVNRPRE